MMKQYRGWVAVLAALAAVAGAEAPPETANRWVGEVMATPDKATPTNSLTGSGSGDSGSSLREFFKQNVSHTSIG